MKKTSKALTREVIKNLKVKREGDIYRLSYLNEQDQPHSNTYSRWEIINILKFFKRCCTVIKEEYSDKCCMCGNQTKAPYKVYSHISNCLCERCLASLRAYERSAYNRLSGR